VNSLLAVRRADPQAAGTGLGAAPSPDVLGYSDDRVHLQVEGTEASLSAGPDLVVAVSGRVDELPRGSASGRASTAAERVLQAVRQRGPDALQGAAGDFVAVWYDRQSAELAVFRDIAGTVPAYLVAGRHQVVATSLGVAVAAAGDLSVDWDWVSSYLAGSWPEVGRSP
jgi:hypothetical protein